MIKILWIFFLNFILLCLSIGCLVGGIIKHGALLEVTRYWIEFIEEEIKRDI